MCNSLQTLTVMLSCATYPTRHAGHVGKHRQIISQAPIQAGDIYEQQAFHGQFQDRQSSQMKVIECFLLHLVILTWVEDTLPAGNLQGKQ